MRMFFVCLFLFCFHLKLHQRQPCEATEQNEMKEAHKKKILLRSLCVPGISSKHFPQLSASSYFSVIFPSFIFDPFKTPSLDFVVLISLPRQPTKRSSHKRRTGAARVTVICILDIFLLTVKACLFFLVFLSVINTSFAASCSVLLPRSSLTQILCQGLSVCF